MGNRKILCVGLCCVDVINEVTRFPQEDSDQRCISQLKQRGGNASNNTTILGLLGEEPHYFGVIADSSELNFIRQDFNKFGVNGDAAVIKQGHENPTAWVILSKETGSRTIIHYNAGLPEVTLKEFEVIDLYQFSWIHFEGRDIEEIPKMVQHIRDFCSESGAKITISIELEKIDNTLEALIPFADVLFLSKDFALSMSWNTMEDAVSKIYAKYSPSGRVICAWGELGAAAKMDDSSAVVVSKAFPPQKIVDTLGAGDTFIAGVIYKLNKGCHLNESIRFGCRLAGAKIGHKGWNLELKQVFQKIID